MYDEDLGSNPNSRAIAASSLAESRCRDRFLKVSTAASMRLIASNCLLRNSSRAFRDVATSDLRCSPLVRRSYSNASVFMHPLFTIPLATSDQCSIAGESAESDDPPTDRRWDEKGKPRSCFLSARTGRRRARRRASDGVLSTSTRTSRRSAGTSEKHRIRDATNSASLQSASCDIDELSINTVLTSRPSMERLRGRGIRLVNYELSGEARQVSVAKNRPSATFWKCQANWPAPAAPVRMEVATRSTSR